MGEQLVLQKMPNCYEKIKLIISKTKKMIDFLSSLAQIFVGNINAARLYFEAKSCLNNQQPEGTKIKTQNN